MDKIAHLLLDDFDMRFKNLNLFLGLVDDNLYHPIGTFLDLDYVGIIAHNKIELKLRRMESLYYILN